MLRPLRASRSLPSLRSTALSHAATPPTPNLPVGNCTPARMASTAPSRALRPQKSMTTMTPDTSVTLPKKRGRPRKESIAPKIHKRSNSTDAKSKKAGKEDQVPVIPQPDKTLKKTSRKLKQREAETTPQAADKFQEQAPAPVAKDEHVPRINTTDGSDATDPGRVQALGREAEKYAEAAVEAIGTGMQATSKVQDLLTKTLDRAKGAASTITAAGKETTDNSSEGSKSEKDSKSNKQDHGSGEIPQGEKNVLLAMLGLGGLWVAFGGKLTKKDKRKKQAERINE